MRDPYEILCVAKTATADDGTSCRTPRGATGAGGTAPTPPPKRMFALTPGVSTAVRRKPVLGDPGPARTRADSRAAALRAAAASTVPNPTSSL